MRFSSKTLEAVKAGIEQFEARRILRKEQVISTGMDQALNGAKHPFRNAPIVGPGNTEVLRCLLAKGIPTVVERVKLPGDWSPKGWSAMYGEEMVNVYVGSNRKPTKMKFRQFLDEFQVTPEDGLARKLKVSSIVL